MGLAPFDVYHIYFRGMLHTGTDSHERGINIRYKTKKKRIHSFSDPQSVYLYLVILAFLDLQHLILNEVFCYSLI